MAGNAPCRVSRNSPHPANMPMRRILDPAKPFGANFIVGSDNPIFPNSIRLKLLPETGSSPKGIRESSLRNRQGNIEDAARRPNSLMRIRSRPACSVFRCSASLRHYVFVSRISAQAFRSYFDINDIRLGFSIRPEGSALRQLQTRGRLGCRFRMILQLPPTKV